MFKVPTAIENKLTKLEEIVNEYPDYIPVSVAADFLGAKVEGLRAYIETGKCPFAFSWNREMATINTRGKAVGKHQGRTAFKIPTTTFFMWYTNSKII